MHERGGKEANEKEKLDSARGRKGRKEVRHRHTTKSAGIQGRQDFVFVLVSSCFVSCHAIHAIPDERVKTRPYLAARIASFTSPTYLPEL
jgi:hypothetical protein